MNLRKVVSGLYIFLVTQLCCLIFSTQGWAQAEEPEAPKETKEQVEEPKEKISLKGLSIRGYTQMRYNRLLETNPDLECAQCDRSWGGNGGLFLRRARIVFSGQVTDRLFVYIQPDFAAEVSGSLNYVQIRDIYADFYLDERKTSRIRFGQSKIPYGFENLQSSRNRVPLDRTDGINSAVANERDIAVIYYWAPEEIRDRLRFLESSGLKGSGEYGVFGIGVFNGQTANRPQIGKAMHTVARVSWPFMFKNGQFLEAGIQGYTGKYMIPTSLRTNGPAEPLEFKDSRAAGSIFLYPQPFGFQAEYNVGVGPEFNPATMQIEERRLNGGYAMAMFKMDLGGSRTIIPFARYHFYNGGKKHETDARLYRVNEQEIGVEWQLFKNFEIVTMWTYSDRTFEDAKRLNNRQTGSLLRLQVQFMY
jgi:hypothetical protein